MNLAKILLLPFNSRVVKSAAKICSLPLEGRALQDLPALDFCCSLMGLQETYSVFMVLHRLPLDFCVPRGLTFLLYLRLLCLGFCRQDLGFLF